MVVGSNPVTVFFFLLKVWPLYNCVSIMLIAFLMGALLNNDSTSKDTYIYPFTSKMDGVSCMRLTASNESFKVNSLLVNGYNN